MIAELPHGSPEGNIPDKRKREERRFDRRYRITLDLRWKVVRRRKVLSSGSGWTVDLSSGGVLFDARSELPAGQEVELAISWPALLHNSIPMQLVISGKTVRSELGRTAVQIGQHEFRTTGVPANSRGLQKPSGGRSGFLVYPGRPGDFVH